MLKIPLSHEPLCGLYQTNIKNGTSQGTDDIFMTLTVISRSQGGLRILTSLLK